MQTKSDVYSMSDDTINLINYQLTLLISYKLLSSY